MQVSPGIFFGVDDALRLSFGMPPSKLQQGLDVLAMGLAALI